MLARITDKENPVVGMKPFNELIYLARRSKRGLVKDIKGLSAGIGLLSSGEMALKG
jgi:hypothetical protein